MTLTKREKTIVAVSNALTIYAIKRSENDISPNVTPHKFVLDTLPENVRGQISADIIDDIYMSLTNGS